MRGSYIPKRRQWLNKILSSIPTFLPIVQRINFQGHFQVFVIKRGFIESHALSLSYLIYVQLGLVSYILVIYYKNALYINDSKT